MVPIQIKAILFDLGDTLLNFGPINTLGLLKEAGYRSYSFLRQTNQPVGGYTYYLWYNFIGLRLNYFISGITGNDFNSLDVLKKYGKRKGFDLSEEQWEHVNWLWYEPLCEKASVEDDLVGTLEKLKALGLKLGIISNTFVNGTTLDRHLSEVGVLDFFPMRLYSYSFSRRKPHQSIFLEASRKLEVDPCNIMYVGDRVDNDVKGCRNAGMFPVLKKAYTNENKQVPEGTVTIETISQLPDIVKKINNISDTGKLCGSDEVECLPGNENVDGGEEYVKQR